MHWILIRVPSQDLSHSMCREGGQPIWGDTKIEKRESVKVFLVGRGDARKLAREPAFLGLESCTRVMSHQRNNPDRSIQVKEEASTVETVQ